MKIRSAVALMALAAGTTPALAQGFQDINGIESEVAAFAGGDPSSPLAVLIPVDRRLRLAACASPLDLAWPGNRRDSVLVRCPDPGSWKLYVRLQAGAAAFGAPAGPVIKRGDAVTVTLTGRGFSVSQSGEAMDSGAVDEWVRVRMGKDSEMRAQVLRPGVVGINLP